MVILFYTTYMYMSVDLARHEIFRAKVGKGGIKVDLPFIILLLILNRSNCVILIYSTGSMTILKSKGNNSSITQAILTELSVQFKTIAMIFSLSYKKVQSIGYMY